jgi:hypothetical protein
VVGGDHGQKIELAPLGGKWDGAKLYRFNTHQHFEVGKHGWGESELFAWSVPLRSSPMA